MREDLFLGLLALGVLFTYAFVGLFLTVLYMIMNEGQVGDSRLVSILVGIWPLAFPVLVLMEVVNLVRRR